MSEYVVEEPSDRSASWRVHEQIVRCKDCECSYALEHFMPGRLLCKLNNGVWKPEDFCSHGVPVAETRRASDE